MSKPVFLNTTQSRTSSLWLPVPIAFPARYRASLPEALLQTEGLGAEEVTKLVIDWWPLPEADANRLLREHLVGGEFAGFVISDIGLPSWKQGQRADGIDMEAFARDVLAGLADDSLGSTSFGRKAKLQVFWRPVSSGRGYTIDLPPRPNIPISPSLNAFPREIVEFVTHFSGLMLGGEKPSADPCRFFTGRVRPLFVDPADLKYDWGEVPEEWVGSLVLFSVGNGDQILVNRDGKFGRWYHEIGWSRGGAEEPFLSLSSPEIMGTLIDGAKSSPFGDISKEMREGYERIMKAGSDPDASDEDKKLFEHFNEPRGECVKPGPYQSLGAVIERFLFEMDREFRRYFSESDPGYRPGEYDDTFDREDEKDPPWFS